MELFFGVSTLVLRKWLAKMTQMAVWAKIPKNVPNGLIFLELAISGAIWAVPFALGGPVGPIWVPGSSACTQTWPKTFDMNENVAIFVFWLHVKKRTKKHVFSL